MKAAISSCSNDRCFEPAIMEAAIKLALPGANLEQLQELYDFCIEHRIQLYPIPGDMLWVRKAGFSPDLGKKQIHPRVVAFWSAYYSLTGEGPGILYAVEKFSKGKKVLKGAKLTFSKFYLSFLDGNNQPVNEEIGAFTRVIEYDRASLEANPNISSEELDKLENEALYIHELGTWMLEWFMFQTQNLTPGQLLHLTRLLNPHIKKGVWTDGEGEDLQVGVNITKKALEYSFNFSKGEIHSNVGTSQELMNMCSVAGVGYKALPFLLLLLNVVGSRKYEGSIPAFLNLLPNLWARDDGSYGATPEDWHATGIAKKDLRLPLGGHYQNPETRMKCGKWPHVVPYNASFSPELIAQITSVEGASVPDKYNMKSATGVRGALAMLMWMGYNSNEEYVVHTLHDASKPSKWGNRPTQARLFSFAEALIKHSDGSEEERGQNAMSNTLVYKSRCSWSSDKMMR